MQQRRGERGQILPVVTLVLVALLGISAFSIDVGYAYYAKRQLQSATDAAALAGAQDLPTAATAIASATSYASANTPANLSTVNFAYETKCTSAALAGFGCSALTNPNALVVNATASTHTWFAKIFGISSFTVAARAKACSPCSSSPVDVVVALDRTGSMCDSTDANGCKDLNNAKDGVHTLLSMLNPPYAQVGMVAFPPLATASTPICNAPQDTSNNYTAYDSANRRYLTDQIGSSYKNADGTKNLSSGLYLHTVEGDDSKCVRPNGYTSYSEALRQAKKELDLHGRVNVADVIVFLTDGEANIGSVYGPDTIYPPGNADDQQPCHTAQNLADSYKAQGVTIYSIGYALGNNKRCTAGEWEEIPAEYNKKGKLISAARPCDPDLDGTCTHKADDHNESPTIYSDDTVENIASAGGFYNKSAGGDLSTIFAAIATDIGSGSSRLVDDGY